MSHKKRLWFVLGLVVCAAALPVLADDHDHGDHRHDGRHHHRLGDDDHEIARGALERGEIVPLEDVLVEVRKAVAGQIVGIKLEREGGTWIYEFRILGTDGSMLEVYADARTKAILKVKGR
jgi:uncharacterized membrane protein YkoI